MRVLVIDDSEVARAYIRRVLENVGATVFEQPSAIGATRNILQNQVEAVVVDVTMPGLSGDRLVEVLKNNQRLKGLVVVLVSGKPFEELQAIEQESRADAVLSKDEIESRLAKTLNRLRAHSSVALSLSGSASANVHRR